MNIRTLNLIGISCLLLQATPVFSAPGEQQVTEQDLANKFAAFFNTQIAEDDITGAAFAVATPAGTVRIGTAGYTDTSHSRAIDANTTAAASCR